MGDEADWLIDQAMGFGDPDFDEYGEYNPRPRRRRRPDVLNGRFWIDAEGRKLYPERPPHAGGMTLPHILAVKAKLLKDYGEDRLRNTYLWHALSAGERMHEGELQKSKDINKGVIQW